MQIFSNDQTARSDTVQGLGDFNSQSPATQANKGEEIVSMMPVFKKAFDLLGDDIVELSTEKDALKTKIGSHDEKWSEECKTKLFKKFYDKKEQTNLVMS